MATPKAEGAAPSAPEPRQTVAQAYDEFETAFAESLAPAPATEPAVATPSPEGTGAAEGANEDTQAAQAPVPAEAGTDTPAVPSVAAVEPPAPVIEEETPEAKIARLEAENLTLRQPKPAEPVQQPAEPAVESAPAKTGPIEPEWYKPTDEEQQLLTAHETNWPEISRAEAVRTKQAVYNAVQYVFAKLAENYNPVLKRFDEMANAISEQLTLGALRSEHEDYDTVYDAVNEWVETLPAAFKLGAKQIMKEGTPEEVSELISTYKKQAGTQAPAAASTAPTVATRTTELSAPAKKAAMALTVVGSKRTSPVSPPDANDFDGAWAEAVNSK